MKIRIVLTTMLLLIIVSVNSYAQSKAKMTDEQKKEMMDRYDAYKEKLNLTEEQQPEFQKINTEYFVNLAELRESNSPRSVKFQKFRDLTTQKNLKMEKLLTKDQYNIYTEFQKEMRNELIKNR